MEKMQWSIFWFLERQNLLTIKGIYKWIDLPRKIKTSQALKSFPAHSWRPQGTSIAKNSPALMGNWTSYWDISKYSHIRFLRWLDPCLNDQGTLWLSPEVRRLLSTKRQAQIREKLTFSLVYPPDFITQNGWDSGNYIISLDKLF